MQPESIKTHSELFKLQSELTSVDSARFNSTPPARAPAGGQIVDLLHSSHTCNVNFMSENHAAFVGSIPENYDRYLGPPMCRPNAEDLAARLRVAPNASVLELACGTGILTRCLRDRLPAEAKLTATDLNQDMINYAIAKFGSGSVEWKQADATELPLADESFDAIVSQFGVMFVPDKAHAFAEAHRVLKRGGQLLFNVWDSLEYNDFARTGREVVNGFFEDDPPTFYNVPFSSYEREPMRELLAGAGFTDIQVATVPKDATAPSAAELAIGLVEGNPIITAIKERMPEKIPAIRTAVTRALVDRFGDAPVRAKMQAIVWSARKN